MPTQQDLILKNYSQDSFVFKKPSVGFVDSTAANFKLGNFTGSIGEAAERAIAQSIARNFDKPINEEDFNERFGDSGIKFEEGMTASEASMLKQWKTEEEALSFLATEGGDGLINMVTNFTSQLAGSLWHPVDALTLFIPVENLVGIGARVTTQGAKVAAGRVATSSSTRIASKSYANKAYNSLQGVLDNNIKKAAGRGNNVSTKGLNIVKEGLDKTHSAFKVVGGKVPKDLMQSALTMKDKGIRGFASGVLDFTVTEPMLAFMLQDQQLNYSAEDFAMGLMFSGGAGIGFATAPPIFRRAFTGAAVAPIALDAIAASGTSVSQVAAAGIFGKFANDAFNTYSNLEAKTKVDKFTASVSAALNGGDDELIQDIISKADPEVVNELIRQRFDNVADLDGEVIQQARTNLKDSIEADPALAERLKIDPNKIDDSIDQLIFDDLVLDKETGDLGLRSLLEEDIKQKLFDETIGIERAFYEAQQKKPELSKKAAPDEFDRASDSFLFDTPVKKREFLDREIESLETELGVGEVDPEGVETPSQNVFEILEFNGIKLSKLKPIKSELKAISRERDNLSERNEAMNLARENTGLITAVSNNFDASVGELVNQGIDLEVAQDLVTSINNRVQEANAFNGLDADGQPINQLQPNDIDAILDAVEDDFLNPTKANIRTRLITLQKTNQITTFLNQFPKGEKIDALKAFYLGSYRDEGKYSSMRDSVDTAKDAKTLEVIGNLSEQLERQGLLKKWKREEFNTQAFFEAKRQADQGKEISSDIDIDTARAAKTLSNIEAQLLSELNANGTSIRAAAGRVGRRTHDVGKLVSAGFNRWREDVSRLRVKYPPNATTPKAREAYLNRVYDSMVDDRMLTDLLDPFQPVSKLSDRLDESRELVFLDSISEFEYTNSDYVSGNTMENVMLDLMQKARNAALMNKLGPDGVKTHENIKAIMLEGKETKKLNTPIQTAINTANKPDTANFFNLDTIFDKVSGVLDIPDNTTIHAVGRHVLQFKALFLQNLLIRSLPDISNLFFNGSFLGRNSMETLNSLTKGFKSRLSDNEWRSYLTRMGAVSDSMIGSLRGIMDNDLTGMTSRYVRAFMNFTGSYWWNNSINSASVVDANIVLTEFFKGNTPKADLPVIDRIKRQYGFSNKEFAVLKNLIEDIDGHSIISDRKMNDANSIPDKQLNTILKEQGRRQSKPERQKLKTEIFRKYRAYLSDSMRSSVLTADEKTRLITTGGTKAGTIGRLLADTIFSFKTFPISTLTRKMSRGVFGSGAKSVGEFIKDGQYGRMQLIQHAALATFLGYLSNNIADLISGRDVKDPADPETWRRAFAVGGSFGLLGDIMIGELNKDYLLGPIASTGIEASQAVFSGDISGFFNKTKRFIPFLNFPAVYQATNYLFLKDFEDILQEYEESLKGK